MKRITSAMLAAFITAGALLCGVSADAGGGEPALGSIVLARHNIDSHTSQIQKKNAKLLKLTPDELAAASFADYDTSDVIIGTEICEFSDTKGDRTGGSIENAIDGSEDNIVTLGADSYTVRSIEGFSGHTELFPSSTVLRAATGKRVRLDCGYGDDVPEYQIVKDKKNIYIENIDFYDFPVLKFENCENIIINNCTFTGFLDNGVVFRGCSDISVINCTFTDCGVRMSDATSEGYSIRIVGDKDAKTENVLIENCTIDHSYGKAISLVGSVDNYVIRNNKISNTVWGAIDYWTPSVSGEYVNVVENNDILNIGFGAPAEDDKAALKSGVGCAAIFAGMGMTLPKSVVKNNTLKNVVETGIEGPYEIIYHNTIKNTGERSATRYTGSTEAVFIKPSADFEQKYVANDIETRGLRCFSSYSGSESEYTAIYILNNKMSLKKTDPTITCNYARSDIEINCKKLKKLVISGKAATRVCSRLNRA